MYALRPFFALTLLAAAAGAAAQATITHEQALAGNVTPGDAPGYPVTISVPGHYVLKGNLQVPADAGGVFITASSVTLDLNGFAVAGPGSCIGGTTQIACNLPGTGSSDERLALSGIRVSSSASGVTIRNGTVRGVRGHGVAGYGLLLQELFVHSNRYAGLDVGHALSPSIVSATRILRNGGHGIQGTYVLVERSTITHNGGHGMWTTGAQVLDSRLHHNVLRGLVSPGSDHPSLLRNTDLRSNGQGATAGSVVSQGGNFNGTSLF